VSITQWAQVHISSAHADAVGHVHGHTWAIRSHWLDDGQSVLKKQENLRAMASDLDHCLLPEHLTRAEEIAEYIGWKVNAERVDVWREAEGVGACWTR
jgi:hypothetical protein